MTPYGSFFYFGLLLYAGAAVLLASILGVRSRRIIFGATLLMLVVQYGLGDHGLVSAPLLTIARLLAFGVMQWTIATLFLRLRALKSSRPAFYAAVGLSLLPLALEKFSPAGSAH